MMAEYQRLPEARFFEHLFSSLRANLIISLGTLPLAAFLRCHVLARKVGERAQAEPWTFKLDLPLLLRQHPHQSLHQHRNNSVF